MPSLLKAPVWAELQGDLERLRALHLYRDPDVFPSAGKLIDLSLNDYLGLSRHPSVIRAATAAAREWGTGSRASRLLSGNLAIHAKLEEALARFKREGSALVFSSGYLANLGAVSALIDEKDVVITDRLNHASLIDAARLSKAKLWVFGHRDLKRLDSLLKQAGAFRRRLVLTDSYFSMDGTVAPLADMLEICERRSALLMIDEAHATGVFGREGRGLTEHFGVSGRVPVVMGTLSKALGSVGGFITGSELLRRTLVNRCREYIYTTGASPMASAAALEALKVIESQPRLRQKLWKNVERLRGGLKEAGFDLMGSEGPIVPIRVADTKKALALRDALKKAGYFVPAIRPPTVPKGTDRLRVSVSASHSSAELDGFVKALKKAAGR